MTVSMEIEPELESRVQDLFSFDCEKTATDVICQALSFEKFPYEAEINLLLTGDEGIRQMNRDYRQTDRPTDVLSFPMIHYDTPGDFHIWKTMRTISIQIPGKQCLGILLSM